MPATSATWQSIQVIIGAPIGNDTAPNSAAPSDLRKFVTGREQTLLLVQLEDGTSCTATVWCYDIAESKWVQISTGTVSTTVPTLLAVESRATTFVQLTAVVGAPTRCQVMIANGSDDSALLKSAIDANTAALSKQLPLSNPVFAYNGDGTVNTITGYENGVHKVDTFTYNGDGTVAAITRTAV